MVYLLLMDKLAAKINKLILRISKGDEDALNELFLLTRRILYFMAQKYLYDKSYADDLLSETYYKIVRYSSSFNKTKNGLNWIFKILHNEAININRKNGASFECELDENKSYIGFIDDLLDKILVHAALEELSDEEKYIIYLRYWEGLDFQSISNRINKPLSTTFDKIKKIHKKLHSSLK